MHKMFATADVVHHRIELTGPHITDNDASLVYPTIARRRMPRRTRRER